MAPGRGLVGGWRGDAGEVDLPQTAAEISGALIRREPLARFRVRQEQLRSFRLEPAPPLLFLFFRDALMSLFVSLNPGYSDTAGHAGKVERRASVWLVPIFYRATVQTEIFPGKG